MAGDDGSDIRSSLTREASGPLSGQVSWLPGRRPTSGLPRARARVAVPSGTCGGGLAGYSGGTAQAFDLLPFSPRLEEHPDVCPESDSVSPVLSIPKAHTLARIRPTRAPFLQLYGVDKEVDREGARYAEGRRH